MTFTRRCFPLWVYIYFFLQNYTYFLIISIFVIVLSIKFRILNYAGILTFYFPQPWLELIDIRVHIQQGVNQARRGCWDTDLAQKTSHP